MADDEQVGVAFSGGHRSGRTMLDAQLLQIDDGVVTVTREGIELGWELGSEPKAKARALAFAAAQVGYRMSRQFAVRREGDGVWVSCSSEVGPDAFELRCFVPDEDDLTQHAAAVARACERLGPALDAAIAELVPR